MKSNIISSFALGFLVLSGAVSADPSPISGCVATADLPTSILGLQDSIRVTHQQAATESFLENNSVLRVLDENGVLLGTENTFTLGVNESKTFSVEDIYKMAGLTFAQRRMPNKVVQIVESTNGQSNHHDDQATYRTGFGMITPLIFTCEYNAGT